MLTFLFYILRAWLKTPCIVLYCIGKLLLGKCFKSQPTDNECGKKGDSHQCIQVSALYLFEFGNCNVAELV